MGCLTSASSLWAHKILHFATESSLWWRLQSSWLLNKTSGFNISGEKSSSSSLIAPYSWRFPYRDHVAHHFARLLTKDSFPECQPTTNKLLWHPGVQVQYYTLGNRSYLEVFRKHGVEFWVCPCVTLLFWVKLSHSSVHIRSSYSICSLVSLYSPCHSGKCIHSLAFL